MKIVIDKEELEKKLAQGPKNGWLELYIVPSQFDGGTLNPALLHIGQIDDDGLYKDLESISEFRKLRLVNAS
ncbi:hypothetical protein [Scatolibacter rhodanostii]|uniref:hypothetical protein n=1 Tax=Scatolibacter rhodanostii TaxID=2014781 RepID=UPI000C0831E3|nr:hypothetical protein [Scatolibacter rhodanostii]